MSKPTADRYKRIKTRYKGVSYREKADGSRTYFVFSGNRQHRVTGGEKEALLLQAELRTAPEPVIPTTTKFGTFAEYWFEVKSVRVRKRTADYHRSALDLVLLPRFGSWKLAAIDADAVAKLVRDLENEGLHAIDPKRPLRPLGRSSIENYLKPLQGILKLAARRKLISGNPFDVLTSDDRPRREEKKPPHEWTDAQIDAVLQASREIARRPTSRYDYALLIRTAIRLGLRLGEVLGLRWEDFDKETGFVHVRRQWLRSGEYGSTKTKAGVRSIPLPSELRDALIALRLSSRFSRDDHPIFASLKGTPLSHWNVTERGFEAARDLAGLPSSLTFHDMRHAAASRMIDAGLDSVAVAETLGHDDPNVTLKVYAQWFNRKRKAELVRAALS